MPEDAVRQDELAPEDALRTHQIWFTSSSHVSTSWFLFVDENESVARQLKRGEQVRAHNEEVERSGIGEPCEERATDFDEALARRRYRVFKEQTYDALVSLKQIFHFHFINAQASLVVVQENILSELDYQSSLELDPRTFHTLQRIPVAGDIVMHARR